jgi:acyl-CoA reductase-like NAD-dependent aldehyde dehydrogenase
MRTDIIGLMTEKEKDVAAQSMAAKRWAKTSPKERSEYARKLNEARWGKKGSRKKKKA